VNVKVSTPSEVAGVECPKRNGTMDKDKSCRECPQYRKCISVIALAMGACE